jgi:hypothetical protein
LYDFVPKLLISFLAFFEELETEDCFLRLSLPCSSVERVPASGASWGAVRQASTLWKARQKLPDTAGNSVKSLKIQQRKRLVSLFQT